MTQKTNKVVLSLVERKTCPALFAFSAALICRRGPLRTEPLPEQEEGGLPVRVRKARRAKNRALNIEVEVLNTGRKVLLSGRPRILVGRLDAAHGIFPGWT